MLPSVLARQLQVGLIDYVETTFPMTNPIFKGSIRRMLETKTALFHEPYVAVRLPFRVADNVGETFQAVQQSYKPYVHQQRAFDRLTGEDGRSTLVATGTGSGKTECFLYPILDYCHAHRGEPGIKALIIYPMNALASDQAKRIAELIYDNPALRGNVTAGMYVGGYEKSASRGMTRDKIVTDHETMLTSPPDILLTNYKMLDYLLVRPKDASLWKHNKPDTLKYIVVDELHTFDGAQGTDLACLLRRLKARLWTPAGHLCCVGTSATLGAKESVVGMLEYAQKVFGEPFEAESVITEDRVSPYEFFSDYEITDLTFPTPEQAAAMAINAGMEDEEAYLLLAAESWIAEPFDKDYLFSDEGRVLLSECLMHHAFMQGLIEELDGNYAQPSYLIDSLCRKFPNLNDIGTSAATASLDGFLALISHARIFDSNEKLRPFLHVQVQVWLRELRRLLAKVSSNEINFALASDLNEQQSKQYLPVVNCRDCGETGWASMIDERGNIGLPDPNTFYNLYFKRDKKIRMVFPHAEGEQNALKHPKVRLCPHCLHVQPDEHQGQVCSVCGNPTIAAWMPLLDTSGSTERTQFKCPFCGSKGGLSLIGLRSATAISAVISQLYSSRYNDDKKLLAFSDNVQDAAHRAGFFNSRTWRFTLRTAIQQFAIRQGDKLSLSAFAQSFVDYWAQQMSVEEFVSSFIAPNMTWKRAFEQMQQEGKFPATSEGKALLDDIRRRMEYEFFLEFGIGSRIGRTLEKSGCSTVCLDADLINPIIERIHERIHNEVGELRNISREVTDRIVAGWIHRMKISGAFHLSVYEAYVRQGAKDYLISNDRINWLPGMRRGRNTPRFISATGRMADGFDVPDRSSWYGKWIEKNLELSLISPDVSLVISSIIIEEMSKGRVFNELQGPKGIPVWALSPDAISISTGVQQLVCDRCGSTVSVAKENAPLWDQGYCVRDGCSGHLHPQKEALDYYGKLYSTGDLVRIIAHEHTGLLEREDREALEAHFKSKGTDRKPWDANLLSCTPTLEMGIDIGDLSTVVLCSIPPAQSQYLQRVGRAGRKDGNSLTVAVANARPHDLYFYSDPIQMIDGQVAPPEVFLDASAVLARQFVAYCMDCWVKSGIPEQAIPRKLGPCLNKLKTRPDNFFPFNFLNYVQTNLGRLIRTFIQLFSDQLGEESKKELRRFAQGDGLSESPMHIRISEAFEDLYEQRAALRKSIKQLKRMIDDLEKKPKDSSYEEEMRDLRSERHALADVVKSINNKDVFNFFSDEGLLPNYAFPETGIVLKAVLYRRGENLESGINRQRYHKTVYEYNRSASSAISEFAPANSFYAGGRKLNINQIDLSTTQSAKWRLCPNCSHVQLEETGKDMASCPRCGDVLWADSGQVRSMLKVQMVYSNEDYTKSLIGDDSDDRTTVFYNKQMLVDVDEEKDIISAYHVETDHFPFGYEFVQKATMREINFGESDIVGERLTVAGKEDVRKGFVICRHCGMIQDNNGHGKAKHAMSCRAKSQPPAEPFEECMFLYREFVTEALRILIPATTMETSHVRQESFVAAFMLGMKGYFGNVDHLRACISEVPVADSTYRKQYLVIYDSVPGGTGYLKQLMNSETAMVEILEKSLAILENCSCKDTPQKDGCYRCLYAYRQSQHIGEISRKTAIALLQQILSRKSDIEKVKSLGAIPVNTLFESELERQFIGAFDLLGSEQHPIEIHKQLVNNKEGYLLRIGTCLWEVEPQVYMSSQMGISEPSRADFVLRPKRSTQKQRPVAIFTDGFTYHKDKVHDDTLKRAAIINTGEYRVWSLSWKDVQQVYRNQGEYSTPLLLWQTMPSGSRVYLPTVEKEKAKDLDPAKLGAFELLVHYLQNPDAEKLFSSHAKAYALSLLEPAKVNDEQSFLGWQESSAPIIESLLLRDEPYTYGDTMFGVWYPSSSRRGLNVLSGVSVQEYKNEDKNSFTVISVLDDDADNRSDRYEADWNGFWQFANVMQFVPRFAATTSTGLEAEIYGSLSAPDSRDESESPTVVNQLWKETYELFIDDIAKVCAHEMETRGVHPPSAVGYDIADERGEVIGTAEMVWETKKIAWLLPDQVEYRSDLEAIGWTVFTSDEELTLTAFE